MQGERPRPTAGAPADWLLSLSLSPAERLVALLSDGGWNAHLDEAPWPPRGWAALPPSVAEKVAALAGSSLRLQLPLALDDWSWEREIAALRPSGGVVPRFVLDLSAPDPLAADPPPLVVLAEGAAAPALLQAARARGRPFVAVNATTDQARRLEALLRKHWRDPRSLSEALTEALSECPLPLAACRLYGDGPAGIADREQVRRPLTALSIDVVRSTSLLQAGDEAYAERLHAYHELCRDVIERLQGYVDPPRGNDGLMCYFGFPVAVEDSAARALHAAWQVAGRISDLGLSVRMGVASGSVAVSARQAFGADVHLAARLREVAQPGQVLVARATRERVGPGFALTEHPLRHPLKDYPGEVRVWRLDGVPLQGLPGRAGGSSGPFVGRQLELARLHAAWARARGGRLEWCCVTGEAGMGKSRLLREFARALQADGWPCLNLTGHPQWSSSPYAAIVDGLRRREGLDETMDFEQLSRWLAMHDPADTDSSDGGRRAWRDQLLAWMESLAGHGPMVFLVDDAHWLDPSSVDLLRRFQQRCQALSVLVVAGERTDSARTVSLADSAPIELQGLNAEESAALAGALGAALSERVRRRIVERAEGVPLFLEEESIRLLGQADTDTPGSLPATLEDLLMVRLDALGPDRTLAQLIAVVGRECAEFLLQALLALEDPFVERARRKGSIQSLLSSGLLQRLDEVPPVYRFKHALIRDAAYASIWANDRRRLHGLCADLMERHMPEIARQRPEQLAQHLEAAHRLGDAQLSWQKAAHLAAARQAHTETLDHARRALALSTVPVESADPTQAQAARATMQMHLLVASAQMALEGYGSPEVESAYLAAERAGKQLPGRGYALRIRLGLEACYVMRGDLARAADLAQEVVAQTRWEDDPHLALQARWAMANVQFHQGDWVRALAGFDDCLQHYRLELHRPSGVQDPAVMCLGYSSWIQFEIGQADEALARIRRMLALADEIRHPFSSAVAHSFAASILRLCGDTEGAWPHALETQRICELGDFQVWLAHAWMVRGQLRADRGDVAGGDADMLQGYDRWTGSGARISAATYRITRAEILLRQCRTADAASELDAAWQLSESIGERYYQAELLRLQALSAWQAGDTARAAAGLDRALTLAVSQGRAGLALRCALSAGALDAGAGRIAQAATRLRTVVAPLSRHGCCRDWRKSLEALSAWDQGRLLQSSPHTPWEFV